jgi:uncharacterized protein YjbJ (UPF0337 family)
MSKDNLNDDVFKGKLQQIKGDLQKKFSKLTDDDLTSLKGNFNEFAGKVHEKYGIEKADLKTKINELLNKNKTSANTETTTRTTTTYKKDNK